MLKSTWNAVAFTSLQYRDIRSVWNRTESHLNASWHLKHHWYTLFRTRGWRSSWYCRRSSHISNLKQTTFPSRNRTTVTSVWRWTWHRADVAFWLRMKIELTSVLDTNLSIFKCNYMPYIYMSFYCKYYYCKITTVYGKVTYGFLERFWERVICFS